MCARPWWPAATRSSASTTSTRSTPARTRSGTSKACAAMRASGSSRRTWRATRCRSRRDPGAPSRGQAGRAPVARGSRRLQRGERDRDGAGVRGGATGRRAAGGVRLVLLGLRRRHARPLRRRCSGGLADLAVRREQARRRTDGARFRTPLRNADRLPAVLHRVRAAPATRPGDPPLHRPDRARLGGADARRRVERAGLYLYYGLRGRRPLGRGVDRAAPPGGRGGGTFPFMRPGGRAAGGAGGGPGGPARGGGGGAGGVGGAGVAEPINI